MSSTKKRTERDSLGAVEVAGARLWGAQTQRALTHFDISEERMPLAVVHAVTLVKKAAAVVNFELGILDEKKARAIGAAADEVLGGDHDEEFPLVVWQTGSGTQTHMNVNEVLANRASELWVVPAGKACRTSQRRCQHGTVFERRVSLCHALGRRHYAEVSSSSRR